MSGRSNLYGAATDALCGSCADDLTIRRLVEMWIAVDREPELNLEMAVLMAFLQAFEVALHKRKSLDKELVDVLEALDWRADNRGDPGLGKALEVWYEKRVKDLSRLSIEEQGRRALLNILCNALPDPLAAPPKAAIEQRSPEEAE